MSKYDESRAPSSAEIKRLEIAELVYDDPQCQARVELQPEAIDEYAERYADGDMSPMPPISIFMVGKRPYVVDGFHRVYGAIKAERGWIDAVIVGEGDLDLARLHATMSNQAHGIRRTAADKERAVRLYLDNPIGGEQSSRQIAKDVGVSHPFVSKVRAEWEREHDAAQPERRRGSDGKWRPVSTGNVSSCPPNPAELHDPDRGNSPDAAPKAPGVASKAAAEPTDRHAKIASMIRSLRSQIKQRFGTSQTIDRHLEAAWRAADDLVVVDCALCPDGGGCDYCKSGRSTRGQQRRGEDRARGLEKAKAGGFTPDKANGSAA